MRRACQSLARRSVRTQTRKLTQSAPATKTTVTDGNYTLTTLPNKIRVATDNTPGHFSSVGLYVDGGSRYETKEILGASHFLDRLAFKSTLNRSEPEVAGLLHSLGGQVMCNSSREALMYQSSHFHHGTPLATELIADTVLRPALLPEEVELQRDAAMYELRELNDKPETIIPEILHSVAYNNEGLGNSLLCPEDRVNAIDATILRRAMRSWYKPDRMVLAGAGMPHEELVQLAEQHFSTLATAQPASVYRAGGPQQQAPTNILSSSSPSLTKTLTRAASYLYPNSADDSDRIEQALTVKSTYQGGYVHIPRSDLEFDHLYIGYEGVGLNHDDIYAVATMQVLLGGGGSFSAGGPGKGMYSRLYTNILNHFPQVDHCASYHHIYQDSSLFGLFASFVPGHVRGGNTPRQILPHLVHQLSLILYTKLPEVELQRAKNQLKSSLMMSLESQSIQVEDLGRQILSQGRRVPVEEMTAQIDALTAEDLRRVAASIFGVESGKVPTIVSMGASDLGDYHKTFKTYGLSA